MAAPEKKPLETDRETVRRSLQRLQDDGIVDLDAPLRDAIPAIERVVMRLKKERAERLRGGYCMVGDGGWLSQPGTE